MINKGLVYELNRNKISTSMPIDSIKDMDIDAFCKRNVGYGGGYDDDVFPLKVIGGDIYIRNQVISFEEFKTIILNSDCSWIVQERIKNQLDFVSQFHPSSINTIRIVTVQHNAGIDAICAFARFGINGRGSDNWSSGGVIVGIDVETGRMEDYGLLKPGVGTKCFMHPTTAVEFKGKIIPDWDNIVSYVKSLHELFYDLHLLVMR